MNTSIVCMKYVSHPCSFNRHLTLVKEMYLSVSILHPSGSNTRLIMFYGLPCCFITTIIQLGNDGIDHPSDSTSDLTFVLEYTYLVVENGSRSVCPQTTSYVENLSC